MASHPVVRMLLAAVGCWAAVSFATGAGSRGPVLLGAAGPLVVAVVSWVLVERTHARAPARVQGLLIALFGAKLVLFGAYVAAAVLRLPEGQVPFVVSFTAHYIVLHAVEAWGLRRLFSGGAAALGR